MNRNNTGSTSDTLLGIELFRGIAAIMVVIYHISRHYERNFGEFPFTHITEFGRSGVDFFFTLSGFIIYYVHRKDINHKVMMYPYFVKRFARVYPFYWFMLLLHLIMVPFVSSATFPAFIELLKEIALWPKGMDELIIGVSWSLQHEIVFYLLFSSLIFNKSLCIFLMTLWFGAIVIVNFICPSPLKIPVILSVYNIQFFMGMLSAFILVRFEVKAGAIWMAVGFIAFMATAFCEICGYIDGLGKYARIFYGLSSMLLIIGIVAYERIHGLTMPSVGKMLGRSSYSIYLTHLFFTGIFFKVFSLVGFIALLHHTISATIIIVLVIIAACIFSSFIEMPLTKKTRIYLFR